MNDEDHCTTRAMIERGNNFVRSLGLAARRADPNNLALIKKTWPLYWEKYEIMADMMLDELELTK